MKKLFIGILMLSGTAFASIESSNIQDFLHSPERSNIHHNEVLKAMDKAFPYDYSSKYEVRVSLDKKAIAVSKISTTSKGFLAGLASGAGERDIKDVYLYQIKNNKLTKRKKVKYPKYGCSASTYGCSRPGYSSSDSISYRSIGFSADSKSLLLGSSHGYKMVSVEEGKTVWGLKKVTEGAFYNGHNRALATPTLSRENATDGGVYFTLRGMHIYYDLVDNVKTNSNGDFVICGQILESVNKSSASPGQWLDIHLSSYKASNKEFPVSYLVTVKSNNGSISATIDESKNWCE